MGVVAYLNMFQPQVSNVSTVKLRLQNRGEKTRYDPQNSAISGLIMAKDRGVCIYCVIFNYYSAF